MGGRVLVTGGERGIGIESARAFSAAGYRVVLATTRATGAAQPTDSHVTLDADFESGAGCRRAVDEAVEVLGGLDCLVHTYEEPAALGIGDLTDINWDRTVQANLGSAMFCAQSAIAPLASSGGSVVFISSVSALFAGDPAFFAYTVAKAGLTGLTRAIATELAPRGIRVNCVCPGFTGTDPLAAVYRELGLGFASVVPRGSMGTHQEVASLIVYLASDDARHVTGAIIPVDGGCTANGSWSAKP